MPVSFDSIGDEHTAVRTDVGRFDISHMGEIEVAGPDATELMQRLTTNDVASMDVGRAQYAAVTDENGIMLEDTIIYRRPDEDGHPRYLFVPNAGNNEVMAERWTTHRDTWNLEASIVDRTTDLAMIAVQGPNAIATVDAVADPDITDLGRFRAERTTIAGVSLWISRTGYTGEDGVELIVDWDDAVDVWEAIECQPVGLGARDTLRLEAGYLLAGNEYHPETNPRTPLEAGIGFAVALETDFVGRDALAAVAEAGSDEELVGIVLQERGIPRQGYRVLDADGKAIGEVTSGTMSPTRNEPIALAYVDADVAEANTEVAVEVRSQAKKAKIEPLPFVDTQ